MPLPTTNLTLHLDASDTDKLFTTWVDGGSHTGTPADGNSVQAWSRETDGSVTPAHGAYSNTAPVYRSGTPLMLLPCLDFNGTNMEMRMVNNTDRTSYIGGFYDLSAKTILIAFYAESITSTAANIDDNHGLLGGDDKLGLHLKDVGGTKTLYFIVHDGAWKNTSKTVSEATNHVLCARHDGTNIYLSVDGGAESSTACGASSGTNATWIGRSIGLERFNGRIGEIAMYNAALTGTDKTDAISYFTTKWVTGGSPDGEEALAGSAITPGHGTQTPGISISI
jgi:hypothetical protein